VNENPSLEGNVRLPHQVSRAGQNARDLLNAANEPPPAEIPPAAVTPPPAVPTPSAFTIEQLLNAPDPERDASRDYWHSRCQMVEGFRREDNRKNQLRFKALEADIAKLTEKNTELVRSHPAAQPAIDLKKHFTEEEIESIGEERATAILRASLQAADAVIQARVDAAIKPLLDKQTQVVEDTEQDRHRKFVEALTDGFPTWQVTDKDPRWLTWLAGVDETSGLQRQKLIDIHKSEYNAGGIVKMLQAFVVSLAPATVPTTPPETPPSLNGTGGDNPPNPAPGSDGKLLTQAEIKDGYKRKAIGKMSKEEAELFDARVAAQMRGAGRA
jgi:hypothetical protein